MTERPAAGGDQQTFPPGERWERKATAAALRKGEEPGGVGRRTGLGRDRGRRRRKVRLVAIAVVAAAAIVGVVTAEGKQGTKRGEPTMAQKPTSFVCRQARVTFWWQYD